MTTPPWRTRNVLALGLVSLLTDAGSEMIMPLLPIFLAGLPGGGPLWLGAVEGLADGAAALLKLWSGRQADRRRRYRPPVLLGYGLSSVARPLVALAALPVHVLLVRVADRIGKGLRSSPRDALLAGAVSADLRGRAFGFHRAMDHTGAVIGPLLALLVLAFAPGDLRLVFALAAIPGALSVLVLWRGVVEVAPPTPSGPPAPPVPLPPGAWRTFLPLILAALSAGSETFLLLRLGATDAPLLLLPLVWMAMSAVKASTAFTGGRLADRFGHRRTAAAGWLLHALIYGALAWVEAPAAILLLALLAGLRFGVSEAAERAMVAALAPDGSRGGAFGWHHLGAGIASVIASLGFGAIWEVAGPRAAFGASAGAALLAVLTMVLLGRRAAG